MLTVGVLAMLALAHAREDGWIVQTAQGPVRGHVGVTGAYEFKGIPYATAPKGEHKFKAALPPPTDVFESDRDVLCPQFKMEHSMLKGAFYDEDCLVVNVFVPKTENKMLPVILYVHGGAFIMGAGDMATHEQLLKHEIIVVNFNYRLSVYGFLCLGTKDIPGNAGMKDQVAALRWVKRNIASFGGNPNDITIAGYSAGSASVEHLMLSPMAKGLFTKVIPESGSALSAWAITPDPIAVAKRYMFDISGQTTDDIKEIEKFYKSLTPEQLTAKIYMAEPTSTFEFTPCVEAKIEGEESFYTESPLDILRKGEYSKVPIMPGFATEEGLFRIDLFDNWSVDMNNNFSDFLPQDLVFKSDDEKKKVAAEIKKFYFKSDPINTDKIKEYVDYFTDVLFGYSIIKSARLHAQNSVPVYLYDFSYITSIRIPHPHIDKIIGANHCAQSGLLNRFTFLGPLNFTKEDLLVRDRLSQMWTNFVKHGSPTPKTTSLLPVMWQPVDPNEMNYLHIDLEMEPGRRLLQQRVEFWDRIYSTHYRQPTPPVPTVQRTEL